MAKYIIPFDEIRAGDVALAGGKGANLGELTAAGIPVPEGAVLCAAAYDRFIEENGIDVPALMQGGASEEALSRTLTEQIERGALPGDIEREIRAFYRSLGEGARVAVRSSATAEDLADASFAGQQETYLNVRGEAAVLEKVKACYASLWGVRAIHYRGVSGYGDKPVSLAVVIQRMVESESAGVLFTRSPSGDGDDILINAAYGLGEAVVSGIVSPDEYRCGRDGAVKRVILGEKAVQIVYAGDGTAQVAVDVDARARRVLDDDQARALTAEGLKIEAHYGRPMDIEWAMRQGKIYILQARPITTLGGGQARAFTEHDFMFLPKAVPARGRMRENILFNLEKLPRPYKPLDHDFGDLVGKQKEVLIGQIGVKMGEMTPIDGDGISSFHLGGMRPTAKIVRLPGFVRQMKDHRANMAASTAELDACRESCARECATPCEDIQSVGRALERMHALIARTAYARFRYAIFPQVVENIGLNRALKRVDGRLNSFDLLEGLSYVTADLNREMAALAADIRSDEARTQMVMTQPWARILEDDAQLRPRLQAFMARFGHRSDFNCYCFEARSWNDEPDRFLHSLRAMLRGDGQDVPTLAEGKAKFDALMQRARAALGEKKYRHFEEKVAAVRHYHTIREATQYLWETEFAHCRALLRRAEALLGVPYDDLMYLFVEELYDVCRAGALSDGHRALIAKRKAKRPLAEAYWDRSLAIMLDTGRADVTGVCGSTGRATGRACVVRGPEEFGKLQKGDILVCPYTDPEWTPLFTLAAGVVVDTGGTLSHAAIVAREYKIPALLATGSATSRIADGDRVLVDADAGKATILKSE